jgi:tRNA 2-thiocytidine biosynthesis protein TtcA
MELVRSKAEVLTETNVAIKIRKKIVEAIAKFNLISEGDRVVVCCSGGKDSSILLALLTEIQKRAPYNYELEAVMLDQGHPGFDPRDFQNWVQSLGVKLTILSKDTYSIVKEKITDGVYCSLCSRLRRGILYDYAANNGFNKMALGHHADDMIETLMMNQFFTGFDLSLSGSHYEITAKGYTLTEIIKPSLRGDKVLSSIEFQASSCQRVFGGL